MYKRQVQRQGARKPARILPDYLPPVDPEAEAKKKQISEVESGLKNYGFKKSEATLFANASTGDSVESHIENALQLAGSGSR